MEQVERQLDDHGIEITEPVEFGGEPSYSSEIPTAMLLSFINQLANVCLIEIELIPARLSNGASP